MANLKRDPLLDYLFEAIMTLESADDCYRFFEDLCTVKEISEMAKRLCAAKLLAGSAVYTEVNEKTGLSTATISRINRCLKYGSDGYRDVLRALDEKGIAMPLLSEDGREKTED